MSEEFPSESNPPNRLPTEDECRAAAEEYADVLMDIPDVHGIGVGDHWVNVYVSRLAPVGDSPTADHIPAELEISRDDGKTVAVPTRVIAQDPLEPEDLEE
ncbi:hypothetical protein ACFYY9_18465 [Streptomyces nigra]|uniref:hypothetical protein n=1 Tax=Streptomyces nigra TaxID=1827580 RepID=UPI0036B528D4